MTRKSSKVDVRVGREEFRHSPTTRVNQCHRTASVFALSLLDRDIFSPGGIHYAVRLTFRKLVSRIVSAVDAESLYYPPPPSRTNLELGQTNISPPILDHFLSFLA
jgi:hypothetical protein